MQTLSVIITILQLLSGVAVTAIVLMQSGKSAGLSGVVSGGADTFLSKGRSTPFAGWEVRGKCMMTVCGGKVAYMDKELECSVQSAELRVES